MSKKSSDRPRLFVGSSTDSLDFAYAIQGNLESDSEVTVWKQKGVFELTKSAVDSLIVALDRSDFAVFVFAPTDVVRLGRRNYSAVRDNVVFELGLFMGKLGRRRIFVVRPKGNDSLRIPTDLAGLTLGTFDPSRKDKNLEAAFGPFCSAVRKAIRRLGPRVARKTKAVATARTAHKAQTGSYLEVGSLTPSDSTEDSVVLERPRVPFIGGQTADFLLRELPRACHGFTLKLGIPREPYWRAGFVLAPEDYIREGRSDIEISRYFLFHVGRGRGGNPLHSTELHYQAYYRGGVLTGPSPLDVKIAENFLQISVGLGGGTNCRASVGIGSFGYSTTIDPAFTRYLYVLAWADGLAPFRVPAVLDTH